MLSVLLIAAFCWLYLKALGLVFRVTWGMVKLVGSLLILMAAPVLILMLLFAGGLLLLIPLAMVALGILILKILL